MNDLKDKVIEIVVIEHNTPIELFMCMSSLKLFTRNCRAIIVNNGQKINHLEGVKNDRTIKTIIQEGNLGFCKGVNRGVQDVETEHFAVLPADCMVTRGWEERMIYQYQTLENPGIVATMCSETSGTQGIESRGLPPQVIKCNRIILNGAVMKKEDFLKVGGMDEGFPNTGGNFSDDDLSRRYVLAGFNNYILNHLIYHNQGRSYGGPSEAMIKDFEQGRAYYMKKWKGEWNY